jgi:hypothetical protein
MDINIPTPSLSILATADLATAALAIAAVAAALTSPYNPKLSVSTAWQTSPPSRRRRRRPHIGIQSHIESIQHANLQSVWRGARRCSWDTVAIIHRHASHSSDLLTQYVF